MNATFGWWSVDTIAEADMHCVHQRDKYGATMLKAMGWIRSDDLVTNLLERGSDPDASDNHGRRPISGGVRIPLLVSYGAEVDFVNSDGYTPLMSAIENVGPAYTLIDNGADVINWERKPINPSSFTVYIQSLREERMHLMRLAIGKGFGVVAEMLV